VRDARARARRGPGCGRAASSRVCGGPTRLSRARGESAGAARAGAFDPLHALAGRSRRAAHPRDPRRARGRAAARGRGARRRRRVRPARLRPAPGDHAHLGRRRRGHGRRALVDPGLGVRRLPRRYPAQQHAR
jgi:hypothetical protein